jgi:RHS repeat-associated protein
VPILRGGRSKRALRRPSFRLLSRRPAALLALVLGLLLAGGAWLDGAHTSEAAGAKQRAAAVPAARNVVTSTEDVRTTQRSIRKARAAAARRRAKLAGPTAKRARVRSRAVHRDLSASKALRLARRTHPDVAVQRRWRGPLIERGERISRYETPTSGLITVAGSGQLSRVESLGGPFAAGPQPGVAVPAAQLRSIDLVLKSSKAGWRPTRTAVDVRLPRTTRSRLAVGPGLSVGLDRGAGERASRGRRTGATKVFYSQLRADTDAIAEPIADGVAVSWLLRSPRSPARLRFDLGSAKVRNRRPGVDGSLSLVQAGRPVGAVSAPMAFDAQGTPVAARFVVEGRRVSVKVDHRDRDLAYPIAVDPVVRRPTAGTAAGAGGSAPPPAQSSWAAGTAQADGRFRFVDDGAGPVIDARGTRSGRDGSGSAWYAFDPIRTSAPWRVVLTDARLGHRSKAGGACVKAGIHGPTGWATAFHAYWAGGNGRGPMPWHTTPARVPTGAGRGTYEDCSGSRPPAFAQVCARSSCTPLAGAEGTNDHFVAFQLSTAGTAADGAFAGAYVYHRENVAPTITATGTWQQDRWGTFKDGVTVNVAAHDDGVGLCGDADAGFPPVVVLRDGRTDAQLGTAGNGGCTGMTTDRPAPTDGSYAITVPAAGLPEGRTILKTEAVDAVGNKSSTAELTAFVDRSAPEIALGGTLYGGRASGIGVEESRTLTVRATDGDPAGGAKASRSGVQRVEVRLDGAVVEAVDQTDGGASAPLDAAWTLPFSSLEPGPHTVEVRAVDRLGHVSTQRFDVRADAPATPALEPGLGFEDWQTYDSTATGAGSTHRVNLATGNSLWSVTPVTNPGIGFDTSLRLTYNSLEPSALRPERVADQPYAYGVAGRGVSVQVGSITRLNEPLQIEATDGGPLTSGSSDGVRRIVLTDGDGTRQVFSRARIRGQVRFTAPPGVHLELRRFENTESSPRHWAATRPDGSTFFFYRDGRPSESQDRHGNILRLTWEERPDFGASPAKAGCGSAPSCRYRVSEVVDAAALRPAGLVGEATAAEDRKWVLHYDASDSLRLTGIDDRKRLPGSGTTRRRTTLTYDSDDRLTRVAVAANAPSGAPQRTWELGYVPSTAFLSTVTDPVGNDTRIRYTGAQGESTPLKGRIDQLMGFAASAPETRRVAGVADRASTGSGSGESRERVFRYATPEGTGGNAELSTWIRSARNASSRFTMDGRGRLTRVVEDLDDPTRSDDGLPAAPSVSPSYLELGSTQRWDDAVNAVASATRGVKGAGPYDTSQATTTEYRWGALGQLEEEREHKGVTGDRPGGDDERARSWSYATHDGAIEGEGDGGRSFVYDVTSQTDRRGKTTTYEYFPGEKGDVEKVRGPGGAEERFTYEEHGLVTSHSVRQWGGDDNGDDGDKPSWAKADPNLVGDVSEKTLRTDTYGEFDANGDPRLRVDARGKSWRTAYDDTGNAVLVGDPRAGGLSPQTGPEQAALARSDAPAAALTGALRDAARSGAGGAQAYVARFTYDSLNRQVASATPKRSASAVADRFVVTATTYDGNDNAVAERDGEGGLTQRTFTKTDRVESEQDPAAPHHAEPGNGQAEEWQNGAARSPVTAYGYDADDNQVVRKDPVPGGNEPITAPGHRTRWTFDRLARTVLQVQEGTSDAPAQRKTTSRAFDHRDNVVAEIDPRTNGDADDVTAVANAAAKRQLRYDYGYDAFDRVVRKTENPRTGPEASGTDANRATTWKFDAEDQETETRTPAGRLTKRVYDDRGDLVELLEPFGYDEAAAERTTSFAKTTITRRLDGQPTEIVSPRGHDEGDPANSASSFRTRFRYADTGELERRWMPKVKDQYGAGEWEVRYDVNDVGDPVAIRDARGKLLNNTFLDTGELATTTRPSWWIYDQGEGAIRERGPEDPAPADSATGAGGLPSEPGNGDFGKVEPQGLPDVLPAAGDTAVEYNDRLQPTIVKGQRDEGAGTIDQTLSYDPLGRLTRREIPKQRGDGADDTIQLQWQYDVRGLPRAARRFRAASEGGSATTYWGYDGFGRQTRTTAPPSCQGSGCTAPVTTQSYDRNDVVTAEVLPAESAPSSGRDGTTTGKRRHTVDMADRTVATDDESGAHTETVYDADDLATKRYAPRAFVPAEGGGQPDREDFATSYRRDGGGRVTRERSRVTGPGTPSDLITDTTYDREGNAVRVERPGARNAEGGTGAIEQRTTRRLFDARGLPWKTTVGAGDNATTTVTEYDGAGNLRRTVNPKGVSGTGSDATPKHADEGESGATGHSAWHATVLQYDADQRLISRTMPWNDADGAPDDGDRRRYRQVFERSNRGFVRRITEVFDAGAGAGTPTTDTLIERNLAGWPIQATDRARARGGSAWATVGDPLKYDYDQLGNQTLWSSAGGGRTIQRSFYRSGQLRVKCGRRTSGGSEEQVYSYRYNTGGSLTQIVDWMHYSAPKEAEQCQPAEQDDKPSGVDLEVRKTNIGRDRAQRPTIVNEAWAGGKDTVFRYFGRVPNLVRSVQADGTYDAGAEDQYRGGKATAYSYDEQDRNTQVRVRDGGSLGGEADRTTDMTWWPSGERRSTAKPAISPGKRTVDSRFYNSRGELIRRRAAPAEGDTKSYDYEYDEHGNRTKDERGTSKYNARDQLTEWNRIRRTASGEAIPEDTDDKGYRAPTAKSPAKTTRYKGIDGAGRPAEVEEVIKSPQAGIGVIRTAIETKNVYRGDQLERAERTTKAVPPKGANAVQSASTQTDCFSYNTFGSQTQTARKTTTKQGDSPGDDITPDDPTSSCAGSGGSSWEVENRNVYDTFERQTAGQQRTHGKVDNSDPGTMNGTQAFCYDPLDRRDRRVTGLKGAADPAGTGDENEGRTRAQAACTTAADDPSSGVVAFDYSYVGLSEQLSRETRSGREQSYDYTASGERLGRLKGSGATKEWRAYDTDAQGSVVGLEKPDTGETTPEDDGKLNTYDTDPFGAPVAKDEDVSDEAAANPFRFQGFYKDAETGTYDMQARAYQPSTGRFLQQDRFEDPEADLTLAADPLTSSRYAFTAGNPGTRSEYDGHAGPPAGEGCAPTPSGVRCQPTPPSQKPSKKDVPGCGGNGCKVDPMPNGAGSNVRDNATGRTTPVYNVPTGAGRAPSAEATDTFRVASAAAVATGGSAYAYRQAASDGDVSYACTGGIGRPCFRAVSGSESFDGKGGIGGVMESVGAVGRALTCDPKSPASCLLLAVGGVGGKAVSKGLEGVTASRAALALGSAGAGPTVRRGIYVVRDGDKVYVGQSGNINRRFRQHARSGTFSQDALDNAERYAVSGNRTAREIVEQTRLDLERLENPDAIVNKVNPIGRSRLNLMGKDYVRDRY